MYERRLTVRMRGYWDQLQGEKTMPSIELFNQANLADIWPYCFRLRVNTDRKSYYYEYMGPELITAYGRDLTAQSIPANSKHFPGSRILRELGGLLDNPRPVDDDGSFVNSKNKVVKFRACMLPFGRDDQVTHVITGVSWKAF